MLRFQSVHLRNIVFFKDTKFKFKSGITVIRGLNQNSPRVDRNTNGVGKSLLFSSIPNVIYASTPLSTKKNDKRNVMGKDSSITFGIANGKQKYEIVQRAKGQSVSYDILKNGQSTEVRTATIAEEKIRTDIFPLSEELFYTTAFLSVQRFPTFLRGTAAQRQEFFTEIFNLDHYDRVRAQLNAQIKELKAKTVKLEAVQEQLEETERSIADIAWSDDKAADLARLTLEIDKYNKLFLDCNTALTELQSHLAVANRIDYLNNKLKAYANISPDELRKRKKKIERQLAELSDYEEYQRAYKRYKRDTEKLTFKLRSYERDAERYKEDAELSEVERRIEKLTSKRDKLYSRVSAIERLRDKYVRLQDTLPDKKPARSAADLVRRISELKQIIDLHRVLSKAERSTTEDGKCPLCNNKVDAKRIKRIAEAAIAELPKRESELVAAEGFAELKRIHKEATEFTGCEEQLSTLEKQLDELHAKKSRIVSYNRIRDSIRDIKHTLDSITAPKRVDEPDFGATEDELNKELERIIAAAGLLSDLAVAKSEEKRDFPERKTVKQLKREISEIETRQRKLSKKINTINDTLPTLIADEKRLVQLRESHATYSERIAKFKHQLADLPILEALVKAYSAKGLKVAKLQQISELVQNNLNLYAPLIFAEPFQFKIDIKENDFAVLVDRINGTPSDVRRLSGAESSCFNLLLLLSILPLIPNARRVDTVILDEMDAFMGEPIKLLYAQKFIPMLQSIVPKVVVITTSKVLKFPEDAQNILVVKEGKQSTLEYLNETNGIL